MATLTIRNISPELYDRLKERARRHRRSVSQEAAYLIEQALAQPAAPGELWREVDRVRELIRSRYGSFPDSSALIREDRGR